MEALILLGSEAVSSEPCFPGVLRLSFFLFVTIWVTSLGSVSAKGKLRILRSTPMFYGVPKWFVMPPLSEGPNVGA